MFQSHEPVHLILAAALTMINNYEQVRMWYVHCILCIRNTFHFLMCWKKKLKLILFPEKEFFSSLLTSHFLVTQHF
jgi:hypothetical protein